MGDPNEYDPDNERDALVADGYTCDDIIMRRSQAEVDRRRLIEARHALANKATVARLQADEMFLEIRKLDKEIKELGE